MVEHIQYLISKHDCVIVPGLGGFISQYNDSTISSDRKTINAPFRSISFNAMLIHNDGLLITSIMRADGCTYDQAMDYVNAEVKTIKNQLILDEEFTIAMIGSLKLSDNKLVFYPSKFGVGKNQYYGLKSLNILPLGAQTEEAKALVAEILPIEKNYFSISKSWLKLAASVAILILISFTLTTPVVWNKTNNASVIPEIKAVKADNNVAKDTVAKQKPIMVANTVQASQVGTEISHSKKVEDVALAEEVEVKSEEPHLFTISDNKTSYYVVVSSHTSINEANKYIEKAAQIGDNLKMIESDGKYRLYISNSNSFSVAKSDLKTASKKNRYKDAWIWQSNE